MVAQKSGNGRFAARLSIPSPQGRGLSPRSGKDENCCCRKPRPGMLLRARDELGIDMNDAVFIGDSISDMRAGLAAGVQTILVLTGLGAQHLREYRQEVHGAFCVAESLKRAAEMIVQGSSVHYLNTLI